MKNYFANICLSFFIIIFMSACTSLFTQQKRTIYTPSEQKTLAELNNVNNLFNSIEEVDVALSLNRTDTLALLTNSFHKFSKHFVALDRGKFSDVAFGGIKLYLSEQSAVSKVNFTLKVDALGRKISGHIKANHKIEVGSNELVLRTVFDEIVLKSIEGAKDPNKRIENSKHVASAAKSFMTALNAELLNTPLRVPLNLNILSGINEKTLFHTEDKLHSAKKIWMHTKMHTFIPYISRSGIVLLGASHHKELPKVSVYENDLRQLSLMVEKSIDEALDKSMGVSLYDVQRHTSYYVSKHYLSKQMNTTLEEMDIRTIRKFFLKIAKEDQDYSKDVRFRDKDRLPSCEKVAIACQSILEICERSCSQNYGVHKCTQCEQVKNPFEKARCVSEAEACKTKEALQLYECHKAEDTCEVNNKVTEEQCGIDNIQRVKRCENQKKRLVFENDEILLAKLNLHYDIANSYIVQRIENVKIDEDLDAIDISRDTHISVDSRIGLEIEGRKDEIFSCSLGLDKPLSIHSEVDYKKQKNKFSTSMKNQHDGKINISVTVKPDLKIARLKNTPYDALLATDGFALNCQYHGVSMPSIMGKELLNKEELPYVLNPMLGELELDLREEKFSFLISPAKVGLEKILYPSMKTKAVVFKRQAHFY